MIVLHYLQNSRAQRILWLLEEIGAPYELKVYQRNRSNNLAPESLKRIHPLGKSPVIEDDGVIIAESAVIVEHLLEKHTQGQYAPKESEAWLAARYWMHFVEGSLAPPMVTLHIFSVARRRVPFFVRPILMLIPDQLTKLYYGPTLKAHLDLVEDQLTKHPFIAGDTLTGADFMIIFLLESALHAGTPLGPNTVAYVHRIHARPAYQAALKAAGVPYKYATRV